MDVFAKEDTLLTEPITIPDIFDIKGLAAAVKSTTIQQSIIEIPFSSGPINNWRPSTTVGVKPLVIVPKVCVELPLSNERVPFCNPLFAAFNTFKVTLASPDLPGTPLTNAWIEFIVAAFFDSLTFYNKQFIIL